jgi:hypothetical protein
MVLVMAGEVWAQDQPQEFVEADPRVQDSVERGLAALAKTQAHNGSFGNGAAPVASTALAGLAFLAAGQTPGRSIYDSNIRKAINFLIRNTTKTGYINEGAGRGQGGSGMHGHGYAVLFLSQAYGMADGLSVEQIEEIKDVLSRAIRVCEQAQAPTGGWWYDPTPGMDEGSVTVTQAQALRAAQNAGVRVNLDTVNKAVDYINKTTGPDGMTAYRLGQPGGRPVLTAAGMCVLTYLGQYDNPKIVKGLDYLLKNCKPAGRLTFQGHTYYGTYYATVAMYQGGGRYWKEWWPALRESMLKAQDTNGLWNDGETSRYGASFATALALLCLEVPYRYLPIFQRRSD